MPRKHTTSSRRSHHRLRLLGWLLLIGGLAGLAAAWLAYLYLERMPGELLRYAERRLYGHTKLETVALPVIALVRSRVERPVPPDLPTLGKGVQDRTLPPVQYDDGRPVGTAPHGLAPPATRSVASLEELQRAMQAAQPGDVIELMPGRYTMQRSLSTATAGTAAAPITVRAAVPQSVEILSSTVEGFIVRHAYWNFENLLMRGVCASDGNCEHAFHVVGFARGTVIRNNRIIDFNAHIKVNGHSGQFPDQGLLQFNTLENTHARRTTLPVTPIDLVAASEWSVVDNMIANFHKAHGNGVAYGVFMKGGGSHGRIERNLVICSTQDISDRASQPGRGVRVGISLGGGGTGRSYCRAPCDAEYLHGLVANNVIAHCNDAGIDVNGSVQSMVVHNTLINTGWIDVRNAPASAIVHGNWLEGRLRTRHQGWLEATENETASLASYTPSADALALDWTRQEPPLVSSSPAAQTDFCGRRRQPFSPPGAIGIDGLPCGAPAEIP